MLRVSIPGGALLIMVDPAAASQAKRAGKDGAFEFAVGGKRDNLFSQPLEVEGRVLSLTDTRYTLTGHGGHNLPVDMGQAAVVRLKDVTLLLVERPGPGGTPMMYRCAGLEPKDYKIVVVKSPAGFRAEYGPFASLILLADCPGCASPHFESLPFTKYHKPLEPMQRIEEREEAGWVAEERRPMEDLLA
jgi:microcystin degradation protein MlrC